MHKIQIALFGYEVFNQLLSPTIIDIANYWGFQLRPGIGYSGGLLRQSKDPYLTAGLIMAVLNKPITKETKHTIQNIEHLKSLDQVLPIVQEIDNQLIQLVKNQLGSDYEILITNLNTIDRNKFLAIGTFIYSQYQEKNINAG